MALVMRAMLTLWATKNQTSDLSKTCGALRPRCCTTVERTKHQYRLMTDTRPRRVHYSTKEEDTLASYVKKDFC